MKLFRMWLLSSALLIVLAQTGQAACPEDGATPMNIGPHNPQTTFPLWVLDSEGLALEICPGTDQVNCISVPPEDPVFPNTPTAEELAFAALIGFGNEGFWASADALIDIPAGRAIFVSGVEAAFCPISSTATRAPSPACVSVSTCRTRAPSS